MSATPRSTTVAAVAMAAVLSACGSTTAADRDLSRGQQADADRLAAQARAYEGDPWEDRLRIRSAAYRYVHDSWNPCHFGDNRPKWKEQRGPHCYSRLPGR